MFDIPKIFSKYNLKPTKKFKMEFHEFTGKSYNQFYKPYVMTTNDQDIKIHKKTNDELSLEKIKEYGYKMLFINRKK